MTSLIAPFLQAVVVNKGSDLHIKAGGPPRIRISGTLVPVESEPLSPDQTWAMIRETMPADVAEHYPRFFWEKVEPYIGDALRHLSRTVEGKQWIANLYAHVFAEEHARWRLGPQRSSRRN